MSNFILFADSTCDLSKDIIYNLDIKYIGLSCNLKGKTYTEDCGETLSYKEFYRILREENEMPTTSQVNAYRFKEAFEPYIKENLPILYIAFSSALSGTYNSSLIAKEELLEEYPNADITIIDSKSASTGLGLLVYYSGIMRQQGKSKEEVAIWVEENISKVCHFFTVDSLDHLKRGGRISSTAAAVGGLLQLKPILFANDNGELKNFAKVKGRKKSIKALYEKFADHIVNPEEQTVFISHGDCLEDAESLANMIRDNFTVKDIIINYVGSTIGCHTGAGVLTCFFLGSRREP